MKKLIPPVLLVLSAVTMVTLHFAFPIKSLIFFPFNLLGLIPILLGLSFAKKASTQFSQVDTEIHTFRNPRQLVTQGLFRYSRNPIYLGFLMVLLGLTILLGSVSSFLPVIAFFGAAQFWYIPFEERKMKKQFGQAYDDYKKAVRRWL